MTIDLSVAQAALAESGVKLSDYTCLTPQAARVLARGYRRAQSAKVARDHAQNRIVTHCLDLSGLTALEPETAAALAGWNPVDDRGITDELTCLLLLDGLPEVSSGALAFLAGWKVGSATALLSLQGLHSLSAEQARAIATWDAGVLFQSLDLGGVACLSEPAAAELARWPGEELSIGLSTLPNDVARELSAWQGQRLNLPKLTRIDAASVVSLIPIGPEGLRKSPRTEQENRWDTLLLGGPKTALTGITSQVADWITELRMCGVHVLLSPDSEKAVRENGTY